MAEGIAVQKSKNFDSTFEFLLHQLRLGDPVLELPLLKTTILTRVLHNQAVLPLQSHDSLDFLMEFLDAGQVGFVQTVDLLALFNLEVDLHLFRHFQEPSVQ